MLRDFIIIHTFLKFICTESSETQHLPSLQISLLFTKDLCFTSEKKLKIVTETDNIKTPCSADLLPSTQNIHSSPLELPTPSNLPSHSSATVTHIEESEPPSNPSNEEIPIFKYLLNENGVNFLSAVLGGDEDILNVQAAQHDDNTKVCFFHSVSLFRIILFMR